MKDNKELLETMWKNPANWKGVFYFNAKDRRIIVPKINPSMGWTFNFGNPITYFAVIGGILLILAIDYWF